MSNMLENANESIWGTYTLGALIDALEKCHESASVHFDFAYFVPGELRSYRGDYAHLAFAYDKKNKVTVVELLERCREALGKCYEGYKGGTYRMDRDTPLWVAEYGEATGTALVGVENHSYWDNEFKTITGGYVILHTKYVDV